MTCTEGRGPSGLATVSLSRVLGDVRRSSTRVLVREPLAFPHCHLRKRWTS